MTAAHMGDRLPLTYTEAVVAIAGRDPALAAILIHHHDCIESVKTDSMQNGEQIEAARRDIRATFVAAIGTLVGGLSFVVWQVITHPHGFAS